MNPIIPKIQEEPRIIKAAAPTFKELPLPPPSLIDNENHLDTNGLYQTIKIFKSFLFYLKPANETTCL